jgi:RNA-directed DNA polymerase
MAKASTVAAMSPGLSKGVERAPRAPAGRCHALAHLREVPALERAYPRQRADAAAGVAGITTEQDGQHLEATLQARHARLQDQRSRQQPIRRVHLPKGQGKTRPMGLSACADTRVHAAVREVRAALSAQDFLARSSGFRPGRSAHDAVRPRKRIVEQGDVRGSVEADIGAFFASVDRTALKKRLDVRGADGSRRRRSGTCVHVGGLDGEAVREPALGTAQGAVRSPRLGNV